MQETPAILPPSEPCTATVLPAEFVGPPAWAVDPANELRLIPALRDPAKERNPLKTLARSAAAFFRAQNPAVGSVPHEDERLGNALADLAVTSRRSYCLLATPPRVPLHYDQIAAAVGNHISLNSIPYTPSELRAKVGGFLAPLVSATTTQADRAINTALDRAFTTAWALRGPVAERAAVRPGLGWIAVSGEDDMPHRPTNVPASPFPQFEIPVAVPATGSHSALKLQTRFIIASPTPPASARSPHTLRELPPNPRPQVPDGDNVILFLHGHVSGAEEALTIIPFIHAAGLARGKRFSVISVDLPNCGYSESFDHARIAPTSATQWPSGPFDREPIRTPVLDFIEDFVIAFVDALDQITPIKDRFSGVIGGSLGGNLGLRLGRRSPMPDWLNKGIVSWNAASVWDPFVNDHVKSVAVKHTWVAWQAPELESSRRDYFHEVYDKDVHEVFVASPQPELWYRKHGWEPCKSLSITGSRMARREVYSANLRAWHWRVAGEQLIYSHVDRVERWDNTSPLRYDLNTVRHLLIGCKEDNFTGSNIFDATRTLANLMTRTPGTSLFLLDTGHSVHFERPRFLAEKIADFLPFKRTLRAAGGDFDGDRMADFAVWRPRTGEWFVIDSSSGRARRSSRQWGEPGDIPVPGDYDGDRMADFAVWRPRTGEWFVIDSSTGRARGSSRQWGEPTDIPVPGDYDGDRKTDFAVWRPRTGEWFVIDSSTGRPRSSSQQWGEPGDIPVPGDYDGDRKTDFAVWRPSTGTWFVIDTSTGRQRSQQWGLRGDIPVPGDYDNDGKTDFAVWRPSTGTWFVIDTSTGRQRSQQWGLRGDIPVPGDYDGDRKTDFAVWRPSTGTWFVIDSSTGRQRSQQWGEHADVPV